MAQTLGAVASASARTLNHRAAAMARAVESSQGGLLRLGEAQGSTTTEAWA